jgi:hypothetical protein
MFIPYATSECNPGYDDKYRFCCVCSNNGIMRTLVTYFNGSDGGRGGVYSGMPLIFTAEKLTQP